MVHNLPQLPITDTIENNYILYFQLLEMTIIPYQIPRHNHRLSDVIQSINEALWGRGQIWDIIFTSLYMNQERFDTQGGDKYFV